MLAGFIISFAMSNYLLKVQNKGNEGESKVYLNRQSLVESQQ